MELELNLCKTLHLFLVQSKLVIFICKQLKRPVAFSVVHFDITPQIVTLQNNSFVLTSFNHEGLCVQRLWKQQEACASIGPRANNSEQERRHCFSQPP